MFDAESNVGINTYITKTEGIGGTIKEKPEDFTVEEILKIKLSDEGQFTVIKVKKINWDTLNFVRVLAKKLKISQKRIEYAGTKDKRAVSIQYFTIYGLNEEQLKKLKNVKIKDAEITVLGKSKNRISLGNLLGNKFRILVKNTSNEDKIEDILVEINEKGCPNFFGLQRFGTMRYITHKVGLEILRRNYEEAFWIYVAMPFEGENLEIRKIREELWESRNPVIGLKEYPAYLRYERILLQALREGKTEEQALLRLPKNLKLMFVHAYQSYVFNRVLSERIKEFGNLKILDKDDYVGFFKEENDINVIRDEYYPVEWRYKRVNYLIKVKRAGLAIPLPGYETELRGWTGKMLKDILDEDNISLEDFRHEHAEFSSRGNYRLAEIPYTQFNYKTYEKSVEFKFKLPKGCYATVLLREFTKTCIF